MAWYPPEANLRLRMMNAMSDAANNLNLVEESPPVRNVLENMITEFMDDASEHQFPGFEVNT